MNWLIAWDYKIFTWLNSLAGNEVWFDATAIFVAYWGAFVLPAFLTAFLIIKRRKIDSKSYASSLIITALAARFVFIEAIRLFFERLRPYLAHDNVAQLILKGGEPSFPSGHTATILAVGVVLGRFNKNAGRLTVFFALVVGASRVIAGVHYPLDILGGALVGWLCGLLMIKLFKLG